MTRTAVELVEALRAFVTRDSRHTDECVAASDAITGHIAALDAEVAALRAEVAQLKSDREEVRACCGCKTKAELAAMMENA